MGPGADAPGPWQFCVAPDVPWVSPYHTCPAPAKTSRKESALFNRSFTLSGIGRSMTVEELDGLCAKLIESYQDDIDAYDERAALQVRDDGKTTTQRALDALER